MSTLSNITRHASANMGGLLGIYICNITDVDTVPTPSNQIISDDIVMNSGKTFYRIHIKDNTGRVNWGLQFDAENGRLFDTKISAIIPKQRPEIDAMLETMTDKKFYVLVRDNNDQWRLVGPCKYSYKAATGATNTESNGYDLNFNLKSIEPVPYYTGATSSITTES